jgi:SAM-dependent methyltransferase
MTPISNSRDAIDLHSEQAGLFAERYAAAERDPYAHCFAYSRHRLDRLVDPFLRAQETGYVLDLGCGTGVHLRKLRAQGFEPVGVDGSPDMLASARELNPDIPLHYGDVREELPLSSASFDGAICVEVLRYLPRPELCLQELARVIRPGGWCLLTATPLFNLNGYALVNRLAAGLSVKGLTTLKQYFTTERRICRQLAEAGFDQVRVEGVYWGPLNWIQRLSPGYLRGFLIRWERIDDWLSGQPWAHNFANMLLVSAVRSP